MYLLLVNDDMHVSYPLHAMKFGPLALLNPMILVVDVVPFLLHVSTSYARYYINMGEYLGCLHEISPLYPHKNSSLRE